jgi:hypothetical protein
MFTAKVALFDDYTHLGAFTYTRLSKTEWFWVETGKKVNFPIDWYGTEPNDINEERCLAVHHLTKQFFDIRCYQDYFRRFLCQSVNPV